MRHTFMLILLGGTLWAPLLASPAAAQAAPEARKDPGQAALDVVSMRDCRHPADAKEAQVLTFDQASLEAKLAVSMGKGGEFKVVTVRLWDRREDPRPVVPVVEAARITQGKLHFYTPDLNADPEPVHDRNFVLIGTLGGAQICWATPGSLLKDGARGAKPAASPDDAAPAPRGRRRFRSANFG